MHPIRTPLNTELGLPKDPVIGGASAPMRRPGTMAQAASAAALPRNVRLVVNPPAMILVFIRVVFEEVLPRIETGFNWGVWSLLPPEAWRGEFHCVVVGIAKVEAYNAARPVHTALHWNPEALKV